MKLPAAVLAAAVLAGPAAAAAPSPRAHRGRHRGREGLAADAERPRQGLAGRRDRDARAPSCPARATPRAATGIVEAGAAGSPGFASSQVGPWVSQTTSVYGSTKQASTYWARAVKPGLVGVRRPDRPGGRGSGNQGQGALAGEPALRQGGAADRGLPGRRQPHLPGQDAAKALLRRRPGRQGQHALGDHPHLVRRAQFPPRSRARWPRSSRAGWPSRPPSNRSLRPCYL